MTGRDAPKVRGLPRFFVYLPLCRQDGRVYTGYTANLRRRIKEHNSETNTGYTRDKRWRLLAVKCFLNRDTALLFEKSLKRSRYNKRNWINRTGRLRVICERYGIQSSYLR